MTAVAIASFQSASGFAAAEAAAREKGYAICGAWSPHAISSRTGGRGARGIVTAVVLTGAIGAAALFGLESWSAVFAYPFNSGARALWSWQALLIPMVEFSALAGALGGMTMLFRNARLTRLHDPAFDYKEVGRASRDAFVLALHCDAGREAKAALALLKKAGAMEARLIAR